MKHPLKFALAVAVPLAVLGVGGSASAQPAPTTTPPGGATPATAPAGWPLLVDSTGAIQVNVPTEWTDVDLQPDVLDDGTPSPRIKASTSIADFDASFATSGMVFGQYTVNVAPEQVLAEYVPGPCGAETTEAYDDGVFQGQLRHQTQCGQTGEYYTLAATTAARPGVVFIVEVGIASAAETATVEGILSTFNIAGNTTTPGSTTPGSTTPGTTTPAVPTIPPVPTVPSVTVPNVTVPNVTVPNVTVPNVTVPNVTVPAVTVPAVSVPSVTLPPVTLPSVTVPSVTLPPVTVPGVTVPSVTVPAVSTPSTPAANPVLPDPGVTLPVAADAVELQDDTGHISMDVPADWTAHVTSPQTSPTGGQLPFIAASTDLTAFPTTPGTPNTFAAPGVTYTAQAFSANPTTDYPVALAQCTDAGVEAYDDGLFVGELHHYTNCGGTQTRVFTLHASPTDNSFTAVLVIQLTDADNTDLNTILGSFNTFEGSFATG